MAAADQPSAFRGSVVVRGGPMVEKSEIKIVVRKINFFARGSEKGRIKFMAGTRCIRGSKNFVRTWGLPWISGWWNLLNPS